jgi:hypothetical protein
MSSSIEDSDSADAQSARSESSSPGRPTPPVTYPPSAKDWENHRRIFTDLYRVENKTLDQVMEIMKNEYGFKAT